MDPVSIVLICASVFGSVFILAAFIRQMMLSRDKQLNDKAQMRALAKEVKELEKMRQQMQNNKRFDSHYKILGINKDAIAYIDSKIEELLLKKAALVERYGKVTIQESHSIINGEISSERKAVCDRLKREIDREISFYDSELRQFQERRASLWSAHTDFERLLLNQEKARNTNLDSIYKQHTALLEKVYLRHIDDTEIVAVKNVEASTMTFKDLIIAPLQFLMNYFGISPGISVVQTQIEHETRTEVEKAQEEINDPILSQKDNEDYRKSKEKIYTNMSKVTHPNKTDPFKEEEQEKERTSSSLSPTYA